MLLILCSLGMFAFGLYAVMSRSILRSAIGLALTSVMLAIVFYLMGAPLTAVFELSVCSGLVTVIFIAGVSLSNSRKMDIQREYSDKERNRFLPFLLICAGTILVVLALTINFEPLEMMQTDTTNVFDVFWNTRQVEIWGQIASILCGGVAVAVLFREERRN